MKLTGFEGSDYLLGRMVFAIGILGIFVGVLVSPPIPKVKRRDFSYLLYAIPRALYGVEILKVTKGDIE